MSLGCPRAALAMFRLAFWHWTWRPELVVAMRAELIGGGPAHGQMIAWPVGQAKRIIEGGLYVLIQTNPPRAKFHSYQGRDDGQ